jgi:hypothetical protein
MIQLSLIGNPQNSLAWLMLSSLHPTIQNNHHRHTWHRQAPSPGVLWRLSCWSRSHHDFFCMLWTARLFFSDSLCPSRYVYTQNRKRLLFSLGDVDRLVLPVRYFLCQTPLCAPPLPRQPNPRWNRDRTSMWLTIHTCVYVLKFVCGKRQSLIGAIWRWCHSRYKSAFLCTSIELVSHAPLNNRAALFAIHTFSIHWITVQLISSTYQFLGCIIQIVSPNSIRVKGCFISRLSWCFKVWFNPATPPYLLLRLSLHRPHPILFS